MELSLRNRLVEYPSISMESVWDDDLIVSEVSLEEIQSLAEINGAKDFDMQEIEEYATVQEQEFETVENDVDSLNERLITLEQFYQRISSSGAISKHDAQCLYNVGMESLPDIRTYTDLPSATNYNVSMEKVLDTIKSVGKAVWSAVKTVINACAKVFKRVLEITVSKRAKINRMVTFVQKSSKKFQLVSNDVFKNKLSDMVDKKYLVAAKESIDKWLEYVRLYPVEETVSKLFDGTYLALAQFLIKSAISKDANELLHDKLRNEKWVKAINTELLVDNEQQVYSLCDNFFKYTNNGKQPEKAVTFNIKGFANLTDVPDIIPNSAKIDDILSNWEKIYDYVINKKNTGKTEPFTLTLHDLTEIDSKLTWSKAKNDMYLDTVVKYLDKINKIMSDPAYEDKYENDDKAILKNFKSGFTAARKQLLTQHAFRTVDYDLMTRLTKMCKVLVDVTKVLLKGAK